MMWVETRSCSLFVTTSFSLGHHLVAHEDPDFRCSLSRLEKLSSVLARSPHNACGLYERIQSRLSLDISGASSRGPFQCFYPVFRTCLQLASTSVVVCLASCLYLSWLVQGHHKELHRSSRFWGMQVFLKMSVKCRGSEPGDSVSCLGSLGKQYSLSCCSFSHVMGARTFFFISFQWLY